MTQKRLYLISASAITAVIALILFLVGFNVNARSIAKEKLKSEITALEKKTEALQAQKE